MATVRIVESIKYGGKLFVFLLSVLVLGGGGIGAGAVVARNGIGGSLTDPTVVSSSELAGGLVLAAIGGIVLMSGLLSIGYKLIADAVTKGTVQATKGTAAGAALGNQESNALQASSSNQPISKRRNRVNPGVEQGTQTAGETNSSPASGAEMSEQSDSQPASPDVSTPVDTSDTPAEPTGDTSQETAETGTPGAADSKPPDATDRSSTEADNLEAGTESANEPRIGPPPGSRAAEPGSSSGGEDKPAQDQSETAWASTTQDTDEIQEADEVVETSVGEELRETLETEETDESPREPTAEQIAFGTSEDEPTTEQAADTPEDESDSTESGDESTGGAFFETLEADTSDTEDGQTDERTTPEDE